MPSHHAETGSLIAKLPKPLRWFILAALAAAAVGIFESLRVPASLFLGPMVAGIAVSLMGGGIRMPKEGRIGAQAVIGCLIAGKFTTAILGTMAREWPLFLAVVLLAIGASALSGWLLARSGALPGATALWGSSPGAANAMIVMAEEYGGDARLVAFMQYFRVICVTVAATIVASVYLGPVGAAPAARVWFPPIVWSSFAPSLALAAIGAIAGTALRIPSGAMLVPLVAGASLQAAGIVEVSMPPWILVIAYASLGFYIGLGFTASVLRDAWRALPRIFLSVLGLIAFCGGLSLVLSASLGVDALTAYLATSPGGIDSVAIIGASSQADLSFVMALQTLRVLIVIPTGPLIARFLARTLESPR